MSNWWANKLGGGTPAAPPQPYQQTNGQQIIRPQQHVEQPQITDDYLIQLHKNGQITDAQLLMERTALHGGNRKNGAARFDTGHCPECGSDLYFSRSTASAAGGSAGGRILNTSTGQRVEAAPLCMSCGYRGGIFPQQTGELYDAPQFEEE